MATTNALTEAERSRILELHGDGWSCSRIARELGRSPSTVSRFARDAGLSWDTTRTEQATKVKQASNRERRAALVSRLYDQADKIMDRLDAPTFALVGFDKDGRARVTRVEGDEIPGNEVRALFGMAINALQGAARLEAVDKAGTDNAEAKGILGNLGDALQAAYGQLSHAGGTPTSQLEADATDTDA